MKSSNITPQHSLESKVIFFLCIVGLLFSIYLASDHYSPTPNSSRFCEIGPTISCSAVLRSNYAELFNVPIAFFGVTWFIVLLALTWEVIKSKEDTIWTTSQLLWSSAGLGFVFYLLFAEFILGVICPFCTFIHVLVIGVAFLSWRIWKRKKELQSIPDLIYALRKWIFIVALGHLLILAYFNLNLISNNGTPPPQTSKFSFSRPQPRDL